MSSNLVHVTCIGATTEDRLPVISADPTITLPQPNTWVVVELSAVANPARFYVTFPYGTRSISTLISDEISGNALQTAHFSEAIILSLGLKCATNKQTMTWRKFLWAAV